MADDIVTQSQQHGTYHDNTGTDAEYIEHLELKLDKAADEIERLREAGDWLWEAMSRHDNTRECPQCQDMIRLWTELRGGQQ